MFQDLRYGWRMLLKHKGFTLVAVLSLALGIGANTALFSVVDAVLLRTLSVRDPEALVLFEWEAGSNFRTGGMRGTFTRHPEGRRGASMFRYDIYEKMRSEVSSNDQSPLASLFAFAPLWEQTVVLNEQAEKAEVQVVSGNYFSGLGVEPVIGRGITDEDDKVSAPPVAVVSHTYWEERLGADPAAIGRQIRINNVDFTLIGVLPPDFTGTLQVGQRPPIMVPLAFEPQLLGKGTARATPDRPEMWWLHVMGRLKEGATTLEARESLGATFQNMALEVMPPPRTERDVATLDAKEYPQLVARSGSQGMMEARSRLTYRIYGLFLVVAMVLLIACANVANLLLARAAMRAHEISLRLSLGAGRWRLVRQLLTESVLLGVLGGAAGVIFAYWGIQALAAMMDRYVDFIPLGVDLRLDWRVLGFTFVISLLTGILFGLVPAWRATKADLTSGLKQSRQSSGAVSRLSKGLVIAQVAVSLLLLVGAGLFIRTLYNLQQVKLGFNQESLLLFTLDAGQGGYKEERLEQFYDQLFARLDNLPGVESATFAHIPLISHMMWNTDFLLPGETVKNAGKNTTNCQLVRENYFSTMQIPLLAGRTFTPQDTAQAPRVAIVNQAFARKFFPNDSVIGKRITDSDGKNPMEIIGVVADAKYSSQREEIEPLLYTYWRQGLGMAGWMNFALRVKGEPEQLTSAVRQVVRDLDGNLPLADVTTQVARASQTLGQERLNARLLTFFGALALLLAVIGLSGVLAYSVAQRTNEIGIRMALGAETRDVLRMVVWQGMKLVLIGLAVGATCGYALKRLIASEYISLAEWQRQFGEQLYGVTATDPWTFGVIVLLLVAAALGACLLPARRAARVDPLIALRHE